MEVRSGGQQRKSVEEISKGRTEQRKSAEEVSKRSIRRQQRKSPEEASEEVIRWSRQGRL